MTLPQALGNHHSLRNRSQTSLEIGKSTTNSSCKLSLSLITQTCFCLLSCSHVYVKSITIVRSCSCSISCIFVVYTRRLRSGQWWSLVSNDYCIAGIYFEGINFRGNALWKGFRGFNFREIACLSAACNACDNKFVGINVRVTCLIHENHEHLYPRNILTIRY